MPDQPINCLLHSADGGGGKLLYAVRPAGLPAWLDGLPQQQSGFLRDMGFKAAAQELALLPDETGIGAAVLGLGNDRSPFAFGSLAFGLPDGSTWRLQPGDFDMHDALLGFCLGGYRFATLKPATRGRAQLVCTEPESRDVLAEASAIWMVRDLINTPANLLGPAELAEAAVSLGQRFGAETSITAGDALEAGYPTIAAVGRGSARPPLMASFRWSGSQAHHDAPLVSICGKGVCFDSGGYDLKPSAGMLRMKKDMGGAATALGLAQLIMQADLPIRLAVRIGCVENSVSGTAMRPLDVIRTRSGLTVEIGNTDAEGRLVLCDLLAEAAQESPALLMDFATLTGAARVALGPDLPALFCNDESWAATCLQTATERHDPLWRLPLWDGYDAWLASPIADLNNVSSKPFAGAVVAALFLRRFVTPLAPWVHIDIYAWNDQPQPGRPEGGEAQSIRGLYAALAQRFAATAPNRNRLVTSS
ncbi:MAG TPA: leucyl aminopeptidase family protein [Acetobacteraceae bacterium]|nr:leucyl aminopeptidase family protein [Acetobacteraceae bacterium]